MIEYIFSRLLIMSAAGAAASLLLTLLRPLTKKLFSSRWHYYTYALSLIIFILPLAIKAPQKEITQSTPEKGAAITAVYADDFGDAMPTVTQRKAPIEIKKALDFSEVLSDRRLFFIWLFGTVFFVCFSAVSYMRFSFILSKSSEEYPIKKQCKKLCLYHSRAVTSPLLSGIFKPKLYLPDKKLSDEDLKNIIAHEIIHVKRFDILIKWACMLIRSIHWFNPSIYLLIHFISADCELSCDVAATKAMSNKDKTSYCETILSLISAKNKYTSPVLGMGGTRKNLERRFKTIMSDKTPKKRLAVISAACASIILLSALTASAIIAGNTKAENQEKNAFLLKSTGTQSNDINNNDEAKAPKEENKKESDIPFGNVDSEVDSVSYKVEEEIDEEYMLIPIDEAEGTELRVHPITGEAVSDKTEISYGFDEEKHPAVDYKLKKGTIVTSPLDGIVKTAEYLPDRGNHIEIESLDETTTLVFAHLDDMYVSPGDSVNFGDTVGTVGSTGRATGPHLHVEYYVDGEAQNPVEVFMYEENGEILAAYSEPELIIDEQEENISKPCGEPEQIIN